MGGNPDRFKFLKRQDLNNTMAKIIQNNRQVNIPPKKVLSNFPLDKLAQLTPAPSINSFESTRLTLKKRAKAKFFTNSYTMALASLKSGLQKSYNNTVYGCSTYLEQKGNKITGHYCNNRWCVVCNRIRTAKLINGYGRILTDLPDKQFVSLTVPNVNATELRATIKEMTYTFQLITKAFRKQGVYVIGLRKLECTYNPITRLYHPHFHFIIKGVDVAKKVVCEWLKRYPKASFKAQDIKPTYSNKGSIMELFKYFSKIITKDEVNVYALDKIFTAMQGLRVYQPLGIKKVSEEVEEVIAEIVTDLKEAETTWRWEQNDWIDVNTGECLTGYTPDDAMLTLVNKKIKVLRE